MVDDRFVGHLRDTAVLQQLRRLLLADLKAADGRGADLADLADLFLQRHLGDQVIDLFLNFRVDQHSFSSNAYSQDPFSYSPFVRVSISRSAKTV